MTFNGECFQQIFEVIMGTNVAPIRANVYLAKLEKLLREKCKTEKLVRPILFKRFIDDGFGITKGSTKDIGYWVSEFNLLRDSISVEFMDFQKIENTFIFQRKVVMLNIPLKTLSLGN